MEMGANVPSFCGSSSFLLHVVNIDGMFCHGRRILFGGVGHASVEVGPSWTQAITLHPIIGL